MGEKVFAPEVARIEVVEETPERLVIDYHPLTYLIAGATMGVLCLYAAAWLAGEGNSGPAAMFGFAGVLFIGAFCFLFYRRVTLTLDRAAGTVTHAKRVAFFSRSSTDYPLADLEKATVDAQTTGDTTLTARPVLKFREAGIVPVIVARITGGSPMTASAAINRWLGVPD